MTSQGRRAFRLAGQQSGFGLIEVVISAAVMLLITLGTLALLDGATESNARNRARTLAAGLAEQDQERMRGLGVINLSNYSETRTLTVEGGTYKVESKSDWLRDSTGVPVTCANGSGQAEYMRITSKVTDTRPSSRLKPVKILSLVAPPVGAIGPTQGTLAVYVRNRAGGPQVGMPVAITGPQSGTMPTNELGCAVFNYYKVGNYQVNLNAGGFVSPLGVTNWTTSAVIAPGTVSAPQPLQYDRSARITASFTTQNLAGQTVASSSKWVTAGNSGIGNATGTRVFGSSGTWSSSIAQTDLFPFSDGYSVYSGNCAANDPAAYTANGGAPLLQPVDPGGSYTVNAFHPSVNLRVQRSSGNVPIAGANVVITATDSGCSEKFRYTTNASGALTDPGLPWGRYTVCVDDRPIVGDANSRRVSVSGVLNNRRVGTALQTINIPISGGTAGQWCT